MLDGPGSGCLSSPRTVQGPARSISAPGQKQRLRVDVGQMSPGSLKMILNFYKGGIWGSSKGMWGCFTLGFLYNWNYH